MTDLAAQPLPRLKHLGRIKVVPSGLAQVRIQVAMFEDKAPRYELAMPTVNLMRVFLGGLFVDQKVRIIDRVLNKCTGMITLQPPCT
jgi:hypothetical protein